MLFGGNRGIGYELFLPLILFCLSQHWNCVSLGGILSAVNLFRILFEELRLESTVLRLPLPFLNLRARPYCAFS
jgi:hypothetical protein